MTWSFAVREFRYWLTNYRRTWRGSIYTSFLSPVLYLGAMGLGLGKLVDAHGTARLGGVSYLAFLAPGLLAAAAMQSGIEESTYPVLGSVKWRRTYYAAAASPLRPADIFHGHLLFTIMRLAMNSAIFLVVMAAFGAITSPWVLADRILLYIRNGDTALAAVRELGLEPLTSLVRRSTLEDVFLRLTGRQLED